MISGTTVNNRLRMRELKSMILAKVNAAPDTIQDKLDTIQSSLNQVNDRFTQTENNDVDVNCNFNNNLADQVVSIEECKSEMLTRMNEMEKRVLGASIIGAMLGGFAMRSEERRVGKECRSRWSPYH